MMVNFRCMNWIKRPPAHLVQEEVESGHAQLFVWQFAELFVQLVLRGGQLFPFPGTRRTDGESRFTAQLQHLTVANAVGVKT